MPRIQIDLAVRLVDSAAVDVVGADLPPYHKTLLADFDPSVASAFSLTGALVNSFSARAGYGSVMTASGAARPTYSATALNSKPGLVYDGVANILTGASLLASLIDGNAPYSAYFIGRLTAAGATGVKVPYSFSESSGFNRIQPYFDATTDIENYVRFDGGVVSSVGTQVASATLFDHVGIFTGTSYSSWINNVASISAAANDRAPPATHLAMGGLIFNSSAVQFFAGALGRFLFYAGAHDATQRAATRTWLRSFY